MAPQRIAGRYLVRREVGRGGMGAVWLCRDERLGREVAVKQLGLLPGEPSTQLARALREARHSAALSHPHVVGIYDAVEYGDHVWLVMEYIPSRTLSQIIREDGPLLPFRAAWIGAQVADGLAAAHAIGMIHRDVKPGNVLVRSDDWALISDFGIARTLGDEQLTRSGIVTGTPSYFAPELARGEEPSAAADVWGLGATLYAAVEGQPPYPEQVNAIALLNTIATQPPPPPQQAGLLTDAIRTMMADDPQDRWTMAQAAAELHQIVEAERAKDTVKRAALPPAREPRTEVFPAVEPEPETAPEPMPQQPAPEQPARRRGGWLAASLALAMLVLVGGGGWWLATRDDGAGTAADPGGAAPKATHSRHHKASSTPSPSGSDTGSTPPPSAVGTPSSSDSSDTASTGTTPVSSGSRTDFVATYYSYLPDDTDSAWSLLSPGLQASLGRDTFVGFWRTIDSVSVDSTRADGSDGVDVTLTYVTNGRSEQETRRLEVSPTDGGFEISADDGAISGGG